jgi:hypothetical protein
MSALPNAQTIACSNGHSPLKVGHFRMFVLRARIRQDRR